jgi:DNA-binding beta-propeller fold protein YncE
MLKKLTLPRCLNAHLGLAYLLAGLMACSPLDSANTIVPPVAAEVIAAKTSNRLDDTPTGVAPSYMFLRKWGSKGNGDGQFNFPTGIAVDNSGNLYVADKENHRVQKFSSESTFLVKWGTGAVATASSTTRQA